MLLKNYQTVNMQVVYSPSKDKFSNRSIWEGEGVNTDSHTV